MFAQEADLKMNSYIITMLVVFYFQIEKLLPPVCQLQKSNEARMIGGKYDVFLPNAIILAKCQIIYLMIWNFKQTCNN